MSATAKPPTPKLEADNRRVLIVDDDVQYAKSISRALLHAGYDVKTIEAASDAVDLIMSESFDVIVSDIHMPGMSGVDLLSLVRSYDLDVPVMLLTAEPSLETAMEAVQLGALSYFVKPVPPDDLTKAVARAAGLHRLARLKREALDALGGPEVLSGDRAGLIKSFDQALATIDLVFQPIVRAEGGEVFGYEGFLRANARGLPTPTAILDAANRLDRMPELGRRVRGLASSTLRRVPADTVLFLNVHPKDLLDAELYEEDRPLTPFASRVVLELSERADLDRVLDVERRVHVLRYLGFRLALDDLGAGYAGLVNFARFEPDFVKIDPALVRGIDASSLKTRLTAAIISVSRDLGMKLIAEGVETREEAAVLRELGCDLLQGHLFAKPGPAFPAAHWPF